MIYIDNAATTRKKPISVILSAIREMVFSANAGRGGHKASVKCGLRIEKTREIIRKYFFDGHVVFTKNCTEALNLGILGLNLSGEVVTTVFDHNSVLRPLKKLENEGKIRLRIISPEDGGLERALRDTLNDKTSLVVMSARSNVTGQRINVERLAEITKRYSKALFFVDCAQSAGHDVFSFRNVDLVASSGHKGLSGLQGSGFLLFKKNLVVSPIITGGTGTSSFSLELPKEIPEGLEAGTQNSIGIISLRYGIEHAYDNVQRINDKIGKLAKALYDRIKDEKNVIIYSCEGGVLLCNVKGKESGFVADTLSERYGICVRGGLHCAPLAHKYLGTEKNGAVRFSFGENNNFVHVLFAAFALKKIARSQ